MTRQTDESPHTRTFDAAVVGAGIAGLAAANYLARAGLSVIVLERSHTLGGRAITRRDQGFSLNLGPHALYRAGAAGRALDELGIVPQGARTTGSRAMAIYRGKRYAMPYSPFKLLTTRLFSTAAKLEVSGLLRRFGSIDSDALARVTASDWIDTAVRHDEVRAFLRGLFRLTTYAADLDRLSAGAVIRQVQIALAGGVQYLDGGWQSLVELLQRQAAEHGARIAPGAPVVAVDFGEAVRGVRLADGSSVRADNVVLAVDPRTAKRLTTRNGVSPFDAAASSAVPVYAASLDLALAGGRRRANFALGLDRPLYFSVHSHWARLAPPRGHVVHAAMYLQAAPGRDTGAIRRELENLVTSMLPEWRRYVVAERFLPSLVVSHALVTASAGYEGRQTVAVESVAGMYSAGDWVGEEGMLADASFASAREAAQRIIGARRRERPAA